MNSKYYVNIAKQDQPPPKSQYYVNVNKKSDGQKTISQYYVNIAKQESPPAPPPVLAAHPSPLHRYPCPSRGHRSPDGHTVHINGKRNMEVLK